MLYLSAYFVKQVLLLTSSARVMPANVCMREVKMQQQEVIRGRWHVLSNAEKLFTVVIMLSLVIGLGLLVLQASGLAVLPGIASLLS